MVLDILLYGDTPNPLNLPAQWPCECRERPDDAPPPEPPWQRMTMEECHAHCAANQAAYDAWEAAQPAPGPSVADLQAQLAILQAQIDALTGDEEPDVLQQLQNQIAQLAAQVQAMTGGN